MTKENRYAKIQDKYRVMIREAEAMYKMSGLNRDREYVEYLKQRLKRYTI